MASITLFKMHGDQNIAHIYEHIWAAHVSSFFRAMHLYAYVDYTLDAKTYDTGLIEITINLYTEEAKVLVENLKNVKISLDEARIEIAFLQVFAENEQILGTSLDDLKSALLELDSSQWNTNEPRPKRDEKSSNIVWPIQSVETRDVLLTIERVGNYEPFDIAMFYVLCMILVSNLQEDMSDGFGLFSESDKTEISDAHMEHINTFKTALVKYEFSDEKEMICELLVQILSEDVLQRFVEGISRSDDEEILPFTTMSQLSGVDINLSVWNDKASLRQLLSMSESMKISMSSEQDKLILR